MSREEAAAKAYYDGPHEFDEDIEDGSMCMCGVPALVHFFVEPQQQGELVHYCGVQTRPARYADPEPAEYCDAEVEHEGDLCPAHEEPDDDYQYEKWKDSRHDD